MRPILPLLTLFCTLALIACDPAKPSPQQVADARADSSSQAATAASAKDIRRSLARINSTQQSWSPRQPWEKGTPAKRRGLGAIVAAGQVLTTAELVADATYLELESTDGTRFAPAKVIVVDYEANLALIGAADDKQGETFFAGTAPFPLAGPSRIGDSLEIVQIQENGEAIRTPGALQSTDLASSLLPGHNFLVYRIKASMQEAASSFTLPILRDGALAGLLYSYDSKDQLCEVAATDIVDRFLNAARSGNYVGFPSLGISVARTEDASFRQWLKLPDEVGGLYVRRVRPGSSAAQAGLKNGDVLTSIDGRPIDRRGFYQHPNYGPMPWGHLVRGEKSVGETISLGVRRDGQALELPAKLTREEDSSKLVPTHTYDQAPNFLIKGGMLFQELTLPYLMEFGENWRSQAPLNLMDAYENPENHEGRLRRVVFLAGVIPTPATVGYERLRHLIVTHVNGKEIVDLKSLQEALAGNLGGRHAVEFADENLTIHLDEQVCTAVDAELLKRGLSQLSRVK